jgi:hypothetical protein
VKEDRTVISETIRVGVTLEADCETEAFLESLEAALGRPVRPVRRMKSVRLLSLWLTRAELEKTKSLPGVRRAEPEGRAELPPKPRTARK